MLVSRTTSTRSVHLIVDQVEYLPLVISVIAILDLANGKIQHATAHGVIDEPGQVALFAAGAGKKSANHSVCFLSVNAGVKVHHWPA